MLVTFSSRKFLEIGPRSWNLELLPDSFTAVQAFHLCCKLYKLEVFILNLRYVGVIRLLFSTGPLYLVGLWLSEGERTNTINTRVQKSLDYVLEFYYLQILLLLHTQ